VHETVLRMTFVAVLHYNIEQNKSFIFNGFDKDCYLNLTDQLIYCLQKMKELVLLTEHCVFLYKQVLRIPWYI